jgi:hypothetical protein
MVRLKRTVIIGDKAHMYVVLFFLILFNHLLLMFLAYFYTCKLYIFLITTSYGALEADESTMGNGMSKVTY